MIYISIIILEIEKQLLDITLLYINNFKFLIVNKFMLKIKKSLKNLKTI